MISKVIELGVHTISGFWFIILVNKVLPDLGSATKKNSCLFFFGSEVTG